MTQAALPSIITVPIAFPQYSDFFSGVYAFLFIQHPTFPSANQKPRRKQRGIKFETPKRAGDMTLAAVAKCQAVAKWLLAVTWLVICGNEFPDHALGILSDGRRGLCPVKISSEYIFASGKGEQALKWTD